MRAAIGAQVATSSSGVWMLLKRMQGAGFGLGLVLAAASWVGGAVAKASGMPPLGVIGGRGMLAGASVGDTGALGAMGLGTGVSTGALPGMTIGQKYMLRLHHTHTGEDISIVYRIGNVYLPEAMEKLNYFLRDHRTQDVANYDPQEFDLLHTLMARLHRPSGVIDIVCGYRTPESNEFLRTRSSVTGVAEHSQHMLSKAIDIQVPGVATKTIRNAALEIGAGGVGYYPTSHFVHVDVGPVRQWQFGGRQTRVLRASARGAHGGAHHRGRGSRRHRVEA